MAASKGLLPEMVKTLAALRPWDGALHGGGATSGEVIASGGSRYQLRRAIALGWVGAYSVNRYAAEKRQAPTYYLTGEGVRVLGSV